MSDAGTEEVCVCVRESRPEVSPNLITTNFSVPLRRYPLLPVHERTRGERVAVAWREELGVCRGS